MPFYDLKCADCREEFNTMAKISDRDQKLIKCPKCGSTNLEAVFKSVNIIQSRKEAFECPNAHKCGAHCHHG